jgi:hypothetical protein
MVSRFMDRSASMTVEQLKREWPTWTNWQRKDFCQSCNWLDKQADYVDMLRFIVAHGGTEEWGSAFAVWAASNLPSEEAFSFLVRALQARGNGTSSNLIQGIATTKHPDADRILRQHLHAIWSDLTLWNDDDFLNWGALDATCCIKCLIELGSSPADFEEYVRKLSQHVCSGNRDSCRKHLFKFYSWLK